MRVNALGPVPVKGLTEPVEVFELVGATAVRQRFQARAAQGLTRFVGRQRELDALHQALEQAGAGHGQVVALVGEAGVGKSRLVYEFAHSHHTQGWRVLESASVSYGKATPYFPVIELLKRYCHLEDHDDHRTMRAKVTGQVLTLDEALQETTPALLALLDALPADSPFLTLDPPQRRQRTLDALKRVLLRESQVQPLVLVFEDLHWIDAETQALLDSLVESLPTARLLLLVNYRPEYQHGWGSKTYYTQLRLDPLPRRVPRNSCRRCWGTIPAWRRSNSCSSPAPRAIRSSWRRACAPWWRRGCWWGSRGPIVSTTPRRAFRCRPRCRRCWRRASIGCRRRQSASCRRRRSLARRCPCRCCRPLPSMPEEALHRGLATLQAAEFLYETRLFPEREYTFKHALTHEVAYGSLLQERRRALHAQHRRSHRTALQDRVADQVERLAHHALRGEVWDKAVAYCRQAGGKATDRSAYQEAVAYLEQALAALRAPP